MADGSAKKKKRRRLIKYYGGFCHYCLVKLKERGSTIDHVIPKSKGGTRIFENCVLACESCNQTRGNMCYKKFRSRFLTVIDSVFMEKCNEM